MVTVLNQVNAEWLYGEVRGQKGKFPATFIDYIPANLTVLSTPTDSSPSGSILVSNKLGLKKIFA